jgi:purine-cytosine permease-like protein
VQDYSNGSKLPTGVAAIVAMVVGLVVAALGVNQAAVIGFEGPLSHMLADADIGFPLAVIASGILYYILRKWEMARTNR